MSSSFPDVFFFYYRWSVVRNAAVVSGSVEQCKFIVRISLYGCVSEVEFCLWIVGKRVG